MPAIILQFPYHVRASVLKPKTLGAGRFPIRDSAFESVKKFSDGMLPRARQLLTAGIPTPTKSATAAVPPRASTMASTVLSMPQDSSRCVNVSSLHTSEVDCDTPKACNTAMPQSTQSIANRLVLTRTALNLTAAELCRRIGCKPNRWSQYENGERRITLEIADRMCDEFGITLDWIYRGDRSGLPQRLRIPDRSAA